MSHVIRYDEIFGIRWRETIKGRYKIQMYRRTYREWEQKQKQKLIQPFIAASIRCIWCNLCYKCYVIYHFAVDSKKKTICLNKVLFILASLIPSYLNVFSSQPYSMFKYSKSLSNNNITAANINNRGVYDCDKCNLFVEQPKIVNRSFALILFYYYSMAFDCIPATSKWNVWTECEQLFLEKSALSRKWTYFNVL